MEGSGGPFLANDGRQKLPVALYDAAATRRLDHLAIEQGVATGYELMQRAGRAAFRLLLRRWPEAQRILVLCGAGNNGGDGYVVAELALQRGLDVCLVAVDDPARLSGDARLAWLDAVKAGVEILVWSPEAAETLLLQLNAADLLVDALLGTGLRGAVRAPYDAVLRLLSQCPRPIVALDIPSGLCADTGADLGQAVMASMTVTFIGLKPGLLTGRGPDCCGDLYFDDLHVPATIYLQVPPVARRIDWSLLWHDLPKRRRAAHKGDCGRLLLVGGDQGMGGAVILAAAAALRSGAGLVYVATRAQHIAPLLARCPEVLAQAVEHANELAPLLAQVDVVVIGPGLGRKAWGQQMWQQLASWGGPLVVDADALNLLSQQTPPEAQMTRQWVMTPHPGEAARLLGCSTAEVEADRFAAVKKLGARWGAASGSAMLLKGAGTLIGLAAEAADETAIELASVGNPGMAAGGMGDVLSGLLGGLLAQGCSPAQAARLAVCLHGQAADAAAETRGYMALTASDVIEAIPALLATAEGLHR